MDLLELFAEQLALNEALNQEYQARKEEKQRQNQIIEQATSQKQALAQLLGLFEIARKIAH